MDKPMIIIWPGEKAEEIKKLINEKFPEIDLKIYTEKPKENPTEELIRKAVEEALKQLSEKPNSNPDIFDPIKPNPYNPGRTWPSPIEQPAILMYGCIPTAFHTISKAEENIKNSGISDVTTGLPNAITSEIIHEI